eukprot:8727625-Pyramimonas_sp.AAC.1
MLECVVPGLMIRVGGRHPNRRPRIDPVAGDHVALKALRPPSRRADVARLIPVGEVPNNAYYIRNLEYPQTGCKTPARWRHEGHWI